MALFFSCLMVGLVVIAVWKRNYKKETIDNILSEGNKKEWLRFLFPMGLWIYDLLSKKQPAQNEEEREWAKALYVREDAKIGLINCFAPPYTISGYVYFLRVCLELLFHFFQIHKYKKQS